MPYPIIPAQAIQAINTELATMNPPGQPIDSLNTDQMSDPGWSCNNFAPAILEQVCVITNTPTDDLQTTGYKPGDPLPASFSSETFVNISMMGEPSGLNHNFNILVLGGVTYLIQAFADQQVNIVRRFTNDAFIGYWHNLSDNVDWTDAYNALFGVDPAVVVTNPPANTWLSSQYVTL